MVCRMANCCPDLQNSPSTEGKLDIKETFKQFFLTNYDLLFRQAFAIVRDTEAARDIVNDVLETIWKGLAARQIRIDNLPSFAHDITYKRCIDHFRRKSTRDKYAQLYLYMAETSETEADDLHAERIHRVMGYIDELPPLTQNILKECYFNGNHYRETAELLGISQSTVKKHIMAALKFFRLQFAKNET